MCVCICIYTRTQYTRRKSPVSSEWTGPSADQGFRKRDGADTRRDRLRGLILFLELRSGSTRSQVVAHMVAKFGLTQKLADQYLDELHGLGFVRSERLAKNISNPQFDLGEGWFCNESAKEFFK